MDKKISDGLLVTISISVNFMATILLFIILKELSSILIPLVLAFFIYFILKPINDYLRTKKIPGILILLSNFLILLFVAYVFTQIIYSSIEQLLSNIDVYTKKLPKMINNLLSDLGIKRKSFYDAVATFDWKVLATSSITAIFNVFNLLFFTMFFYIFIYSGADKLFLTIRKYALPDRKSENYEEAKEKLSTTFDNIISQIQRYIYVKFTNNLMAGITVTIVLYAIGLDYAIVWGLLLFIFEFIPTLGSFLSIIFPTIMSLLQKESFGFTLLVVIAMVLIQTFYFSILEPKRMGNKLGLNPIIIIASLLLWNYLWGIPGMILSVPIMATLKIILANTSSRTLNFIAELMG